MKKIAFLFFLVFIIGVIGCSDEDTAGSTPSSGDSWPDKVISGSSPETTEGFKNPMSLQELNGFMVEMNRYRAAGANCGTRGDFDPQPPLTWNQKLALAAQAHSDDQFEMNRMTHTGSDNSSLGDRIKRAGYEYTAASENVASGFFGSVEGLAEAWMNSDGHCANMMDGRFTEMGIAATRVDTGGGFWTLKLARP